MAKSYDLRNRRKALWKRDPHCHWCGRLTRLLKNKGGGKSEPDQATLDHLHNRLHPERYELNVSKESRYVLSCYQCNSERGRDAQRVAQLMNDPAAFNKDGIEHTSLTKWNGRLLYKIEDVWEAIEHSSQ